MSEFWTFMAAPAASCLILSVLYTYFGVHVLKREIIFVDLSLAQLAALGATTGMVLDVPPESPLVPLLAFGFILGGAAFFSTTRALASRVPQEAVIGIVYVVAASAALLLASRAPHGAEHIKNLLNGSVLWTTWQDVLRIALAGSAVAAVHWKYFRRFREQSENYLVQPFSTPDRIMDFIFFATLGLVIVVSVKTAGVFLIFTLLIVPAVCGALFSNSFAGRWLIGAGLGIATSILGLALSYKFDLPTGATIVTCFGIVFLALLPISRATNARPQ